MVFNIRITTGHFDGSSLEGTLLSIGFRRFCGYCRHARGMGYFAPLRDGLARECVWECVCKYKQLNTYLAGLCGSPCLCPHCRQVYAWCEIVAVDSDTKREIEHHGRRRPQPRFTVIIKSHWYCTTHGGARIAPYTKHTQASSHQPTHGYNVAISALPPQEVSPFLSYSGS